MVVLPGFTLSTASIVTIGAVLSEEFRLMPALPRLAPSSLAAPAEPVASRPVVDRLLIAMASAGHSVAALSLYLGLKEHLVRERIAALDLPAAAETPLRRVGSANPWSESRRCGA